jgi:hypothetical protein
MKQEQRQSICERHHPSKLNSQSNADISPRTEIQWILGRTDSRHIAAAYSLFNAFETQTLVD